MMLDDFVRYRVPKVTIDGPPVDAGTEVEIRLVGEIIEGPAEPGRFFMPRDWTGPRPLDPDEPTVPVDLTVDEAQALVAWVKASTVSLEADLLPAWSRTPCGTGWAKIRDAVDHAAPPADAHSCDAELRAHPSYSPGFGTPAIFDCSCGKRYGYENEESEGASWELMT